MLRPRTDLLGDEAAELQQAAVDPVSAPLLDDLVEPEEEKILLLYY